MTKRKMYYKDTGAEVPYNAPEGSEVHIETEEPTKEDLEEYNQPRSTMGVASFNFEFPIRIGQYEIPKISLGLEEPYSGIDEDTRENKVNELIEYTINKIADTLPSLIKEYSTIKINNGLK